MCGVYECDREISIMGGSDSVKAVVPGGAILNC